MTHPDQPNHPRKAYLLTPAGTAIRARRVSDAAKAAASTNGDRPDAQ